MTTLPPRLEPRGPVEFLHGLLEHSRIEAGLSFATKSGCNSPDSRLYSWGGAVNSSWAAIRASSAGPGSPVHTAAAYGTALDARRVGSWGAEEG